MDEDDMERLCHTLLKPQRKRSQLAGTSQEPRRQKRIEPSMSNPAVFRLNFVNRVALVSVRAAGAIAIVVCIANTPSILAQSSSSAPSADTAKFDVASVKPCKEGVTAGTTGQKGGRSGGGPSLSPDRLDMPCLPLRFFIQLAYVTSANQLNPNGNLRLEGGPAWIDSDRYQINAKADGPVGRGAMQGPMLQALLEDRFKLKIHRETRETPLYALTVASGGPKLQRAGDRSCTEPDAGGAVRDGRPFLPLGSSKLQRTKEGSCTPRDPTQLLPPRQPGSKPSCGVPGVWWAPTGIRPICLGRAWSRLPELSARERSAPSSTTPASRRSLISI
jgi:uncharacterized protein (TIGR03435 family)